MERNGFNIADENEIKLEIVDVIRRRLGQGHFKVFLFGSRVRGGATERSDYDVGIETTKPLPLNDLLDIRSALSDLPILQKIDLIDFGRVTDDFRQVACEAVEILYEQ